jgi:hypothetical protein
LGQVRLTWPNDWQEGSAQVVRALRIFGCEVLRNETLIREAVARVGRHSHTPESIMMIIRSVAWAKLGCW